MIDRCEAIDLINKLSGDEHDWVDMKENYYVLGLENKKADFIKDVAAMANTTTDQDSHYIIIGVEDESGDLVGISSEFNSESDPRHILGVDEADLQQVLTEYVSPTPNVTLHKFIENSPKFGVLSISQIRKKPCVIQKSIYFRGDKKLQRGLIYLRSGSSNIIALRSDIEQIIDERVQNRREEILEGIRKATEIGPEAVASIGDIVHEEGEGEISVEVGEEGDFVMEERFSREPLSDLDNRLTLDMKRWATTSTITIDEGTLWEYYSTPDQLSIDEESVLFLTRASLDIGTYGAFWLTYTDISTIRDILLSASGSYHQDKTISEVFVALGDQKGLEMFYNNISTNTNINPFPGYLDDCSKNPDNRLDCIISNTIHEIEYREWRTSLEVKSMDKDDLRQVIRTLASHMQELKEKSSGFDEWHQKKEDFRDALKDAEITLLVRNIEG